MNPLRLFRFPADMPADLRSNFTHLYWDISWWGLYAGATGAFLTIYAARVGATSQQIGLLTAVPAALSLLLSLPAGLLIRRYPARIVTGWASLISRTLFLAYALLPFLFPLEQQFNAIFVTVLIITVPTTVINISFSQFFMEAVPLNWRAMVVGMRGALFAILSFAVTLVSGQILTYVAFPTGYQIVFFIGFVGGIMTTYHILRVHARAGVHPLPVRSAPEAALPGPAAGLRRLMPVLDDSGLHYVKVIGLLFLFNATNNMVAPLVPGLLVNSLQLSDAMISIGTATSSMLAFITALAMTQAARRINNRTGTAIGAGLLSLQAASLAMASGPLLYLLSAVLGGIASGFLMTSQYNYHLENVPASDQSVWLSRNLLLGNAAVLLGALVGPYLAGLVQIPAALFFFGLLRLLTGLAVLRWGAKRQSS